MEKHKLIKKESTWDFQKITYDTSVSHLAKLFYRSPAQFNRDFYAAAGYSVHEYQRHLRLS